ncbi:hypothetical protein ABGB18_03260 [Nonomuraea sp. B12E4]|uniref:hypothetical protein n=1 Tax=Nonomuraea sp. B12E4 TaxID=3153564 RepID=UPI00325C99B8
MPPRQALTAERGERCRRVLMAGGVVTGTLMLVMAGVLMTGAFGTRTLDAAHWPGREAPTSWHSGPFAFEPLATARRNTPPSTSTPPASNPSAPDPTASGPPASNPSASGAATSPGRSIPPSGSVRAGGDGPAASGVPGGGGAGKYHPRGPAGALPGRGPATSRAPVVSRGPSAGGGRLPITRTPSAGTRPGTRPGVGATAYDSASATAEPGRTRPAGTPIRVLEAVPDPTPARTPEATR